MAIVGDGYSAIPNLVGANSLDAVAIDQALTAIVEQVGGTSWVAGDPMVFPGNLDAANVLTAPRLSNLHKSEPYTPWMIQHLSPGIPDTQVVMGITPCPLVAVAFGFTFCTRTDDTATLTGAMKFFANGVEEGGLEVASIPPGDAYKFYVVGRRYEPGTVIGVDASGLAGSVEGCGDLVFTFWGKTEDVSG